MVKFFYAGILATYTFAGIWKIIGLLKYLLLKQSLPLWLYPNAVLHNVIAMNLDNDVHLGGFYGIFEIPFLWQFMILFVIFIQTFSIIAAIRTRLLPYLIVCLVGMHVFNALFMQVEFYTAIFTLLALFWPFFTKMKAVEIDS